MEYKKLFFLMSLLMIIIPLVSSQSIRFYHEGGENLTVFEKCRVNGAPCDNTYTCNISVINPLETKIVDNQGMLYGLDYYNYSIIGSLLENYGEYESTVDCTNNTFSGSNTFYFQVNPLGSASLESGQGNIIIIAGVLLIILSLFLTYLGFRMVNPLATFGFISFSVLILVFSVGFMLRTLEVTIPGFSDIISNYSIVYTVLVYLLSAAGVGIILFLIKFSFDKFNRLRGIRIE